MGLEVGVAVLAPAGGGSGLMVDERRLHSVKLLVCSSGVRIVNLLVFLPVTLIYPSFRPMRRELLSHLRF